jgi:hypothetical protein
MGRELFEAQGDVYQIRFSADSKQVAITTKTVERGASNSTGQLEGPGFRLHVTLYDIYHHDRSQQLGQLDCKVSLAEILAQQTCYGISRDDELGAVRKDDGSIEVVDLAHSEITPLRYALPKGQAERHVRILQWARDAPVLLAAADSHTGHKDFAEIIIFDGRRKEWRSIAINATVAAELGYGSALGESQPQLWADVSPDGGSVVTVVSHTADQTRFLLSSIPVEAGSKPTQLQADLGAAPVFAWSRDGGYLVVAGSGKAWKWRREGSWEALANPPSLSSVFRYGVNDKGEFGGYGCADAAGNLLPTPSQQCARFMAVIWHYAEPYVSTAILSEFEPGQFTWISNNLGYIASGGGSTPEAYVKVYQAGKPRQTAEDKPKPALHELIQEACKRLQNSPDLMRMKGNEAWCIKPATASAH